MDLLLDGKERMLGGQNGSLQQVVAASLQGSADIVVLRAHADGFFFLILFLEAEFTSYISFVLRFWMQPEVLPAKVLQSGRQRCWRECSSHTYCLPLVLT